jgi:catechol 2,3-dioxygenase-like lactoylglutathione lyase family enzyme
MMHPVAAAQEQSPLLSDSPHGPASINGGVASVSIKDMDRAIKFYTEQLGLSLKARIDNDWTEISAGGGFVIGLHLQEGTTSENKSAVNIELKTTKTLEEVVTKLRERGVEFVDEIKDYPKVRLVTCRDPDGNLVRFAESK